MPPGLPLPNSCVFGPGGSRLSGALPVTWEVREAFWTAGGRVGGWPPHSLELNIGQAVGLMKMNGVYGRILGNRRCLSMFIGVCWCLLAFGVCALFDEGVRQLPLCIAVQDMQGGTRAWGSCITCVIAEMWQVYRGHI